MLLGVASAWAITGGVFGAHRLLRRIGWWGGVATAWSQGLLGFPQMIAGSWAMDFADSLGFAHPSIDAGAPIPLAEELWGLVATLGTAGVMCCAALFFGVLCTAALEPSNPPPTRWTFAKPTGTGLGDFE